MVQQIVVCDDEAHIVRAIFLKLTRADFDVMGASDTASCWRQLTHCSTPAMLIIDDSLPAGSDPFELIHQMRSDARFADLPVILLTSNSTGSSAAPEVVANLKIAAVISKPFSPRHLLATVNDLLMPESDIARIDNAETSTRSNLNGRRISASN